MAWTIGQYSLGGPGNKRAILAAEGLDPDELERLARAGKLQTGWPIGWRARLRHLWSLGLPWRRDLWRIGLGGMVIVFNRFDVYAKGAGAGATPRGPTEASVVLHIFARASRYFLLTGRRLLMLVQSDDPNIVFQNLAFSPVSWNRREFLSANRGI